MHHTALIALGSNLGERRAILDAAVAALRSTPGVDSVAVSSYHDTAPIGGPPGQDAFLNAAARVETSLAPIDLFRSLQGVEADAGRVRRERWGPRVLDLDLLTFGDERLETDALSLPHPRMAVRRFVLAPLAEVAGEIREPSTGLTIAELLGNLDRRPSVLALDLHDGPLLRELAETLAGKLNPSGWIVVHRAWNVAGLRPTFRVVEPGTAMPRDGGDVVYVPSSMEPSALAAELIAVCLGTRAD